MARRYEVVESNLPTSKRCSKCNVVHPRAHFICSRAHKDGLYPWCSACRHAHRVRPQEREKAVLRQRAWRAANPDQQREQTRKYVPAWRAANPDAARVIARKAKETRRARMMNVENTLTAREWADILTTFNHACAYCHRQNVPLEQEHMQPISRGGAHSANNIVPACRSCNASKATRSLIEFARQSTDVTTTDSYALAS